MNKVIFALIGFPLSFLFIIYRAKIKDFTGNIPFAEKYLGSGGTYTFILLLGVIIFIITLLYITDTLQTFMRTVFGPIFFAPPE
ncbi:hypothetical protein ACFLZH_00360 [Patescibacteria group bacterium]